MHRRAALAVPLLLALGCGGAPSDALDTRAGRLARRAVVPVEGGPKRPLHLVDRDSGQTCGLVRARDGEGWRCVPETMAGVAYRDADCTDRVLVVDGTPGQAVRVFDAFALRVERLGAEVAIDAAPYHRVGNRCVPKLGGLEAPAFTSAGVVADSAFVSGAIARVATAGGPDADVFVTSEGDRALLGLVDPVSETACTPTATEAGGRCAPPVETVADEGLRDPGCDRLAVLDYALPPVARVGEAGPIVRLERQDWGTGWAAVGPDGECAAVPDPSPGRKTLAFATPYPPAEWPALHLDQEAGPRLRAPRTVLPDGRAAYPLLGVDPRRFFEDTETGRACGPAWMEGTLRCAPAPSGAMLGDTVFVDDRCEVRGALARNGQAPDEIHAVVVGFGDAGLPEAEVYRMGEPAYHAYAETAAGQCVRLMRRADVYRLGAPVAPETWGELRLELD